jgi:hypothetical protein
MKNKINETVQASFEAISSTATELSSSIGELGRTNLETGKSASQAIGKVVGGKLSSLATLIGTAQLILRMLK